MVYDRKKAGENIHLLSLKQNAIVSADEQRHDLGLSPLTDDEKRKIASRLTLADFEDKPSPEKEVNSQYARLKRRVDRMPHMYRLSKSGMRAGSIYYTEPGKGIFVSSKSPRADRYFKNKNALQSMIRIDFSGSNVKSSDEVDHVARLLKTNIDLKFTNDEIDKDARLFLKNMVDDQARLSKNRIRGW